MYKLLLVDDHDLVRYGIKRALLEHLAELDRIDEASTGQQALGLAQQTAYNLILLDISLPDRNGLDLLTQMREYFPKTAVILLSMHPERDYAIRAFRAGASGYLHKAIPFEKLVHAVSKVLQGEMYISPAVAALLVQEVAAGGGRCPPALRPVRSRVPGGRHDLQWQNADRNGRNARCQHKDHQYLPGPNHVKAQNQDQC